MRTRPCWHYVGSQTPGPGGSTASTSRREMDEILLTESLAAAFAQWKVQKS
jgi:hypothetical protein